MAPSDYHYRTAITGLVVSESAEQFRRATVEEWRRACNIAVDEAWGECQTKTEIQNRAYDEIRDRTALKSQHTVLACHRAAETLKSSVEQSNNDPSKPTFTSPTVTYDTRTMTLSPDEETVSLTVAGKPGRIRCGLALPNADDGYQHRFSTATSGS